jgi:tRNA (guanosine-2'-O-)-methyltransferase
MPIIGQPYISNEMFPHTKSVKFGDKHYSFKEIITRLSPFIGAERREKLHNTAAQRSYDVTTITESIYDQGNINAVIRSSESFGFGSMHIIDSKKIKQTNRVTRGSDKWIDIYRWSNTKDCLNKLKSVGYKIAATHLCDTSVDINEVDFTTPTAIVLGNEKEGVSQDVIDNADVLFKVPTVGLTQSFNISVAGALIYLSAFNQRMQSLGTNSDLNAEQLEILLSKYFLRHVKNHDKILANINN